jgi:hypothetical protein
MAALKTILQLVDFATLTDKEKAELMQLLQNRKREMDEALKAVEQALGKKGKGKGKRSRSSER